MGKIYIQAFCIFLLTTTICSGQFVKEKSIHAQIGLGLTFPTTEVVGEDFQDQGLFVQGEYVLKIASWVDLRPYLGFLTTNSDGEDVNGNPTNNKAETKAALLGGKARLRAPIPWIAPYIELGVGASIGSFETFTLVDDIDKNGIIGHFPFTLGLELGRERNVDIRFAYYLQPSVKQVGGAAALGLTIPLNSKSD